MRVDQVLIAGTLAAACAAANADILAASTFDTGTDGWLTKNGAKELSFVASGGESGGFVMATDDVFGSTLWLWSAPDPFLGDKSSALDGTLSFSLKASNVTSGGQDAPDVKIKGNGITLAIDAGPSPGLGWTSYNLTLAPGAWHLGDLSGALASAADMQSALSNVSALYIRGDYSPLLREASSGLDSVLLASPVPEPGSYALWLAGLLVGASLMRRRR